MILRYCTRSFLGAAIVLSAVAAHAQQDQPASEPMPQPSYMTEPGYVDFDLAKLLSAAEPAVVIQLEKALIEMMVGAFAEEEPELAELMEGLELIRVQVSPVPAENRENAIASVEDTVKGLTAGGWSTMMKVQDNQEQIHVMTRAAGDKLNGLAAFILDPTGEAVFVNVVGEFSPEAIGKLMSKAMAGHGPFMDFDMDWDHMTEHEVEKTVEKAVEGHTIAISAGGDIRLDGAAVNEDALRDALRELADEQPDAQINIRASDDVPFGRVAELMDLAKGIEGQKFAIEFNESN